MLPKRQREILTLVSQGRLLKEVADELQLSVSTVQTHVAFIHARLRTRTLAHAVAIALGQKWI